MNTSSSAALSAAGGVVEVTSGPGPVPSPSPSPCSDGIVDAAATAATVSFTAVAAVATVVVVATDTPLVLVPVPAPAGAGATVCKSDEFLFVVVSTWGGGGEIHSSSRADTASRIARYLLAKGQGQGQCSIV